jgi:hypothetical protein
VLIPRIPQIGRKQEQAKDRVKQAYLAAPHMANERELKAPYCGLPQQRGTDAVIEPQGI